MHAIAHPHLPRIGVLALGAILMAVVLLLLAATRVGDIRLGSSPGSAAPATTRAATIHYGRPAISSWSANPFASPFHVVLPWSNVARR
jgi:hypothetical protein